MAPPPFKAPPPPFKAAPIVARNPPPKKPPPPRARPCKAPPPILQIRRTNSLPTMKSPPMAPSQEFHLPRSRDTSDSIILLGMPLISQRSPTFIVAPPLATLIPENLREDEPEPVRVGFPRSVCCLTRSQSWPVRRDFFTTWPCELGKFRRSHSDSCLWMHWWMPGMDGRDRPPASDSQSDWL